MAKLQSAMEYLMTYGWAILVIAVVLGALYQLGIFGTSTNSLASACLSTTGFLCQTPILNTTGYLGVKFGEIGISTISITALGCSPNATAPTMQSVNIQMASGATTVLQFSCPLTSSKFGTPFKGYLWLTYSTPTQSGVLDRFAVVTSKVTTAGNVTLSLGGIGSASSFNAAISSWNSTISYPEVIAGTSCTTSGGYIYCVGGIGPANIRADVYYAPISSNGIGAWTATTSYPFNLALSQCVTSSGYLYCIGGENLFGTILQNTYYATVSSAGVGAWTATTSYPSNIMYSSCFTSSSYVYCVTNYNNLGAVYPAAYYAPISGSGIGAWTQTTSYPISLDQLSCVVIGSNVVCVGGYEGGVGIHSEVYTAPISSSGIGSWTAVSSYPAGIDTELCVTISGYIYCIAGSNGSNLLNNIYYSHLVSSALTPWSSTTGYPLNIQTSSCISNGGYIYCVGGNTPARVSSTYYAPV
ncbi:MAG: hypothetical protein KGH53_02165 [Candidatus Micrarchaeota archaeon]|nr:hypothetical protein [Candidatus Micrarchaeota archaeon]